MRQRRAGASTALTLPSLVLGTGLLLVVGAATASTAQAQRAAGIGEDAFVLPRWGLRVTVAPTFENIDERFLPGGTRAPFGAQLGGTYDATRLAILRPGESALQSLVGTEARLSLGEVRVVADQRAVVLPLGLEMGLGARIQVGVLVPYVRTTTNIVPYPADVDATAGINPALASAEGRTRNTQLVGQILTAASQREASLGLGANGCAGSAVSGCEAVNQARTAATSLASLYGTGSDASLPASLAGRAGSAAVPIVGSAAAEAIDTRIASLKSALGPEGGVITIESPAHATGPIGAAGLATLLGDQQSGLGLDAFRVVERSHLGDVEGMVKVALIDRIGRLGDAPRSPLGLRLAVAGVVRAPTGQGESPGNALDLGTGDGQTDVELRGALDVTLGRAIWISAAARLVRQLEDDQFVAAPASLEEIPLVPVGAVLRARRDLGDAAAFEVTPRWMPNDYMTVSLTYQVRRKDEDSYEPAEFTTVLDQQQETSAARFVELLGRDTDFTEQRVGFGLTWSTLGAARRGKRVIPLDVSYVRLQTVGGSGGVVPIVGTDQLRLRLWFGRTGRDAR